MADIDWASFLQRVLPSLMSQGQGGYGGGYGQAMPYPQSTYGGYNGQWGYGSGNGGNAYGQAMPYPQPTYQGGYGNYGNGGGYGGMPYGQAMPYPRPTDQGGGYGGQGGYGGRMDPRIQATMQRVMQLYNPQGMNTVYPSQGPGQNYWANIGQQYNAMTPDQRQSMDWSQWQGGGPQRAWNTLSPQQQQQLWSQYGPGSAQQNTPGPAPGYWANIASQYNAMSPDQQQNTDWSRWQGGGPQRVWNTLNPQQQSNIWAQYGAIGAQPGNLSSGYWGNIANQYNAMSPEQRQNTDWTTWQGGGPYAAWQGLSSDQQSNLWQQYEPQQSPGTVPGGTAQDTGF